MHDAVDRKERSQFDWHMLLRLCNGSIAQIRAGQVIFRQGDETDEVFFLAAGRVKDSVISKIGKEGVIGIVQAGDFFGECGLRGHRIHFATAIALSDCRIVRMPSSAVVRAMRTDTSFAGWFADFLLVRVDRLEADVINHLFNSSERRLARLLLILAQFDQNGVDSITPRVDQQTLANMIGTTRPRVCEFMNKFRRAGHISTEDGQTVVHGTLLNVLLNDAAERG